MQLSQFKWVQPQITVGKIFTASISEAFLSVCSAFPRC